MDGLFKSAPATVNAATVTSLVFLFAGLPAVASSLQQVAGSCVMSAIGQFAADPALGVASGNSPGCQS